MGKPLGHIRDEVCHRYGRPRLDALVVAKKGKKELPSSGFFSDVKAADRESWWQDMVQQVYAYDWSDVELEE